MCIYKKPPAEKPFHRDRPSYRILLCQIQRFARKAQSYLSPKRSSPCAVADPSRAIRSDLQRGSGGLGPIRFPFDDSCRLIVPTGVSSIRTRRRSGQKNFQERGQDLRLLTSNDSQA